MDMANLCVAFVVAMVWCIRTITIRFGERGVLQATIVQAAEVKEPFFAWTVEDVVRLPPVIRIHLSKQALRYII